jgi:hypothetical protein
MRRVLGLCLVERQACAVGAGVLAVLPRSGWALLAAVSDHATGHDEPTVPAAVESVNRAKRASRQAQRALLHRGCGRNRAAGPRAGAMTQRPDGAGLPVSSGASVPRAAACVVVGAAIVRALLVAGVSRAASLPPTLQRAASQWLREKSQHATFTRLPFPSQHATVSHRGRGTDGVTQCPLPPIGAAGMPWAAGEAAADTRGWRR